MAKVNRAEQGKTKQNKKPAGVKQTAVWMLNKPFWFMSLENLTLIFFLISK